MRIPIKETYGKNILNRLIDGASDVQLLDQLRGLAIIPGEQNNRLIGFDPRKLSKSSLNCPSVMGRMEYVGRTKTGGKVYVDFAHTPDISDSSVKSIVSIPET